MRNIVVTNNQDFTPEQYERLDKLGNVTFYSSIPSGADEYLERVKGADVICSGTAGLQDAYAQLKDVYITVGFVSVAFVDLDILTQNNVKISNAPGANRHAVSEWILGMIILLTRNLPRALNTSETFRNNGNLPPLTLGLAGNNITILGDGQVGNRVGELAEAFDMNVRYFRRGDNLTRAVADAEVVVNTLSSNKSSYKLLDADFFAAMKEASYFVTITRPEVVDYDAMLASLDNGHLAGAASDCGGALVGDSNDPHYQRLASHPKILATPHIAYNTRMSGQIGNDIMIDNVEAYLKGQPINLLN